MPRADEAAVKQEDYRFPTWWFYFMTAQNFPNMIFEGCLWGIIVPQAIGDIFGYDEKIRVAGQMATAQTAVQILSPLIGDLADKMPARFSDYLRWTCCWGRRRPFVLFGHLTYFAGVCCSYHALYGTVASKNLLVFGQFLMGFSGMLQMPNFAALNAETIPFQQRSESQAIQNTLMFISNTLASILGILVGQGFVEKYMGGDHTIWWIVMAWKVLMVPFMMMQFNARAGCWEPELGMTPETTPGSSSSGVESSTDNLDYTRDAYGTSYKKEGVRTFVVKQSDTSKWMRFARPAPAGDYRRSPSTYYYCNEELSVCTVDPPVEGYLATASPEFSDFARSFSAESLRSGERGCFSRNRDRAIEFFSGFGESAFFWLFWTGFVFNIGQQFFPGQQFFYFFLQDCFPHGYTMFGWTITKSTQTMQSILNLMGTGISMIFSPLSGRLRERCGGRQMLIYTGILVRSRALRVQTSSPSSSHSAAPFSAG